MVVKNLLKKITASTKKYKYVLIVLFIGLLLMIIPDKTDNHSENFSVSVTTEESSASKLEFKLSALLSKVEGAGDVEVILTIAEGEEIVYQTNESSGNSDSNRQHTIDTVTITDSSRNQTGLIKQVVSERYQGAIVVCSGADVPSVRLQLVDAISRITGLGANCISVLKMK